MSWRIGDARAFGDALSGRAPSDAEIAALVAGAEHICALAASVEPAPEFVDSLRGSLLAQAGTVLAPAAAQSSTVAAPSVWTRIAAQSRRRIAIVLAGLITALGMVGLTAASASALPGETLYPVKRGVEEVELTFHRGDSSRGAFLLDLAKRRLEETKGLTKRTAVPAELTADTLDEYGEQADQGSDALVRSFKATRSKGDIVAVNRFATRAAGGLDDLEGKLTGRAAKSLDDAKSQLSAIVAMAAKLCPDCGGIDPALLAALTKPAPSAAPPAPAPAPAAPAAPAAASGGSQSAAEEEEEPDEEEPRQRQEDPAPAPAPKQEAPAPAPPQSGPGNSDHEKPKHEDQGKGND